MDLIAGIVISTSVFLFSMAMVTVFARVPWGEHGARRAEEAGTFTQRMMAVSLVVYFVAVVNLLLIAQLANLAMGSFVVGIVLLVVYYLEPAIRGRGSQAPTEESESWEK